MEALLIINCIILVIAIIMLTYFMYAIFQEEKRANHYKRKYNALKRKLERYIKDNSEDKKDVE